MSATPGCTLSHLEELTDEFGIVEHARLTRPDPRHGHCTDDAGRLLVVLAPYGGDSRSVRLCEVALEFLRGAALARRGFRLRRGPDGAWTSDPSSDDATGRALEGLGAAARSNDHALATRALELFDDAIGWRSPFRRANSHAVLGALAVLGIEPDHRGARAFISDVYPSLMTDATTHRTWPWPEARLTYANALIPEARLALAHDRDDDDTLVRALALLEWLVEHETRGQHFSFTPVGGLGPHDSGPAFDQQPIEAWAMASAATRAFELTHEVRWAEVVVRAYEWFEGRNDVGVAVGDRHTGAGFDGLTATGVNLNQGAESTLAYVACASLRERVLAGSSPLQPGPPF